MTIIQKPQNSDPRIIDVFLFIIFPTRFWTKRPSRLQHPSFLAADSSHGSRSTSYGYSNQGKPLDEQPKKSQGA